MTSTKVVYALLLFMVVMAMGLVAYVRTITPNHSVALDAAGIVQELRTMNEAVAVKYSVQRVIGQPSSADPAAPPMYNVQGTVNAGVDLTKLSDGDVSLDGGVVSIRLPQPDITAVVLDENQTKVWDRSISMWSTHAGFDGEFERQVRPRALNECRQGAVQSGILKEARLRAEAAIRRMLSRAGMTDVRFPAETAAAH